MLQTLVLVIHTLIAIALVWVILIQKSEGGALGVGGGPTGMLSARGATNFLTRTTAYLATAFIATSLILAVLAGYSRKEKPIDASAVQTAPAAPAQAPTSNVPLAK